MYRLATFIYKFSKQAAPLVKNNHHVADGALLRALPLSLPCPEVRSIQTKSSSTLALHPSLLQSHIMSDTARRVATVEIASNTNTEFTSYKCNLITTPPCLFTPTYTCAIIVGHLVHHVNSRVN